MDARATQNTTRENEEEKEEQNAENKKEKQKKTANFIILFSARASRPHTAQRLLARG
jgi:hypothetical protein